LKWREREKGPLWGGEKKKAVRRQVEAKEEKKKQR